MGLFTDQVLQVTSPFPISPPDVFYTFDPLTPAAGTVTDLSGNAHDLTLTVSDQPFKVSGTRLGFDPGTGWRWDEGTGTGNRYAAAQDAALDWGLLPDTTVMFLVRGEIQTSGNQSGAVFVYDENGNGNGLQVFLNQRNVGVTPGGVLFRFAGSGLIEMTTVVLDGCAHLCHLRYTNSTGDMDLFLDGVLVETVNIGIGLQPVNQTDSVWTGGWAPNASANLRYPTDFAAMAWWNSLALPVSEIEAQWCAFEGASFALKCGFLKGGDSLKASPCPLPTDVSAVPDPSTVEVITPPAVAASIAEAPLVPSLVRIVGGASVQQEAPRWRVVITDADGNQIGEMDCKTVLSLESVLNGIGSARLGWARGNQSEIAQTLSRALMKVAETEVQVWRGNQLLFWGPVVRPEVQNSSQVSVQFSEAPWHLTRRNLGPLTPDDLLTNGSFEDNLAGWTGYRINGFGITNGFYPGEVTAVPGSTAGAPAPILGTHLLKMDIPQAQWDADTYSVMAQPILVTIPPGGATVGASFWFYIPSAEWEGPAKLGRGPFITYARPSEMPVPFGPNPLSAAFTASRDLAAGRINEATPKDTWVRQEVVLELPAGTWYVIVRPEGTGGVVYYDNVKLFQEAYLEFEDTDQCEIVTDLTDHLQDPAFGKSDVNIVPVGNPTGRTRTRRYDFLRNLEGWKEVSAFTTLDDGVELGQIYTPTERRLVCYYPRKGRRRPTKPVATGLNVVSYSFLRDGQQAAGEVTVQSTRGRVVAEVQSSTDPTAFGGVTLQRLVGTDDEVLPERLQGIADKQLQTLKNPDALTVTVCEDPHPFIGQIETGDEVRVRIDDDLTDIDAYYRIIRITYAPQDDTTTLSMNFVESAADVQGV